MNERSSIILADLGPEFERIDAALGRPRDPMIPGDRNYYAATGPRALDMARSRYWSEVGSSGDTRYFRVTQAGREALRDRRAAVYGAPVTTRDQEVTAPPLDACTREALENAWRAKIMKKDPAASETLRHPTTVKAEHLRKPKPGSRPLALFEILKADGGWVASVDLARRIGIGNDKVGTVLSDYLTRGRVLRRKVKCPTGDQVQFMCIEDTANADQ